MSQSIDFDFARRSHHLASARFYLLFALLIALLPRGQALLAQIEDYRRGIVLLMTQVQRVDPYFVQTPPAFADTVNLLGATYADIAAGRSRSQERESETREIPKVPERIPELVPETTEIDVSKVSEPELQQKQDVVKPPPRKAHRRGRSPRRRDEKPKSDILLQTPVIKIDEQKSTTELPKDVHKPRQSTPPKQIPVETLKAEQKDRERSPSPMWAPGFTTYAEILRGQYRYDQTAPQKEDTTEQPTIIPIREQVVVKEPEITPVDDYYESRPNMGSSAQSVSTEIHYSEPKGWSAPQVQYQPEYNYTIPTIPADVHQAQTYYQQPIQQSVTNVPPAMYEYIQPVPDLVGFIASGQQLMSSGLGTYHDPNQYINPNIYSQSYEMPSSYTEEYRVHREQPVVDIELPQTVEEPEFRVVTTKETEVVKEKQPSPVRDVVNADLGKSESAQFSYAQVLSQGLNNKPLQPSSQATMLSNANRSKTSRETTSPAHSISSMHKEDIRPQRKESQPRKNRTDTRNIEPVPSVVHRQHKKPTKKEKRYGHIEIKADEFSLEPSYHGEPIFEAMGGDEVQESAAPKDLIVSDIKENIVSPDTDKKHKKQKTQKQKPKTNEDEIEKALKEIESTDRKKKKSIKSFDDLPDNHQVSEETKKKQKKEHVKHITIVKETLKTTIDVDPHAFTDVTEANKADSLKKKKKGKQTFVEERKTKITLESTSEPTENVIEDLKEQLQRASSTESNLNTSTNSIVELAKKSKNKKSKSKKQKSTSDSDVSIEEVVRNKEALHVEPRDIETNTEQKIVGDSESTSSTENILNKELHSEKDAVSQVIENEKISTSLDVAKHLETKNEFDEIVPVNPPTRRKTKTTTALTTVTSHSNTATVTDTTGSGSPRISTEIISFESEKENINPDNDLHELIRKDNETTEAKKASVKQNTNKIIFITHEEVRMQPVRTLKMSFDESSEEFENPDVGSADKDERDSSKSREEQSHNTSDSTHSASESASPTDVNETRNISNLENIDPTLHSTITKAEEIIDTTTGEIEIEQVIFGSVKERPSTKSRDTVLGSLEDFKSQSQEFIQTEKQLAEKMKKKKKRQAIPLDFWIDPKEIENQPTPDIPELNTSDLTPGSQTLTLSRLESIVDQEINGIQDVMDVLDRKTKRKIKGEKVNVPELSIGEGKNNEAEPFVKEDSVGDASNAQKKKKNKKKKGKKDIAESELTATEKSPLQKGDRILEKSEQDIQEINKDDVSETLRTSLDENTSGPAKKKNKKNKKAKEITGDQQNYPEKTIIDRSTENTEASAEPLPVADENASKTKEIHPANSKTEDNVQCESKILVEQLQECSAENVPQDVTTDKKKKKKHKKKTLTNVDKTQQDINDNNVVFLENIQNQEKDTSSILQEQLVENVEVIALQPEEDRAGSKSKSRKKKKVKSVSFEETPQIINIEEDHADNFVVVDPQFISTSPEEAPLPSTEQFIAIEKVQLLEDESEKLADNITQEKEDVTSENTELLESVQSNFVVLEPVLLTAQKENVVECLEINKSTTKEKNDKPTNVLTKVENVPENISIELPETTTLSSTKKEIQILEKEIETANEEQTSPVKKPVNINTTLQTETLHIEQVEDKSVYKGLPLDETSGLWIDILDEPITISDEETEMGSKLPQQEPAQKTEHHAATALQEKSKVTEEKPVYKGLPLDETSELFINILDEPMVLPEEDDVTHVEMRAEIAQQLTMKEKEETLKNTEGLPINPSSEARIDILDQPINLPDDGSATTEKVSLESRQENLFITEKETTVENINIENTETASSKSEEKSAYKGLPLDESSELWIDILDEPITFSDEEQDKKIEAPRTETDIKEQKIEKKESDAQTQNQNVKEKTAYKGLPLDNTSELWIDILDEPITFSDDETDELHENKDIDKSQTFEIIPSKTATVQEGDIKIDHNVAKVETQKTGELSDKFEPQEESEVEGIVTSEVSAIILQSQANENVEIDTVTEPETKSEKTVVPEKELIKVQEIIQIKATEGDIPEVQKTSTTDVIFSGEPHKQEKANSETVTLESKQAYKGLPLDETSQLWIDILDEPMQFSDDEEPEKQDVQEESVLAVERPDDLHVEKLSDALLVDTQEAKEAKDIETSIQETSITAEKQPEEPETQRIVEIIKLERKEVYKGLPLDEMSELWMDILAEPMQFSDEDAEKQETQEKRLTVEKVRDLPADKLSDTLVRQQELLETKEYPDTAIEKTSEARTAVEFTGELEKHEKVHSENIELECKAVYKGLPLDETSELWIDILEEPMQFSDDETNKPETQPKSSLDVEATSSLPIEKPSKALSIASDGIADSETADTEKVEVKEEFNHNIMLDQIKKEIYQSLHFLEQAPHYDYQLIKDAEKLYYESLKQQKVNLEKSSSFKDEGSADVNTFVEEISLQNQEKEKELDKSEYADQISLDRSQAYDDSKRTGLLSEIQNFDILRLLEAESKWHEHRQTAVESKELLAPTETVQEADSCEIPRSDVREQPAVLQEEFSLTITPEVPKQDTSKLLEAKQVWHENVDEGKQKIVTHITEQSQISEEKIYKPGDDKANTKEPESIITEDQEKYKILGLTAEIPRYDIVEMINAEYKWYADKSLKKHTDEKLTEPVAEETNSTVNATLSDVQVTTTIAPTQKEQIIEQFQSVNKEKVDTSNSPKEEEKLLGLIADVPRYDIVGMLNAENDWYANDSLKSHADEKITNVDKALTTDATFLETAIENIKIRQKELKVVTTTEPAIYEYALATEVHEVTQLEVQAPTEVDSPHQEPENAEEAGTGKPDEKNVQILEPKKEVITQISEELTAEEEKQNATLESLPQSTYLSESESDQNVGDNVQYSAEIVEHKELENTEIIKVELSTKEVQEIIVPQNKLLQDVIHGESKEEIIVSEEQVKISTDTPENALSQETIASELQELPLKDGNQQIDQDIELLKEKENTKVIQDILQSSDNAEKEATSKPKAEYVSNTVPFKLPSHITEQFAENAKLNRSVEEMEFTTAEQQINVLEPQIEKLDEQIQTLHIETFEPEINQELIEDTHDLEQKLSQFEDIVQIASEFVPKSEISNLNPDAAVFIPVSKQDFTLYSDTFEEQQPKDELWSYHVYSNEPPDETFDNLTYKTSEEPKKVWTDNTEEVCRDVEHIKKPSIENEKEQIEPLQLSASKNDEFLEKERLACEKDSWETLFINTEEETKSKVVEFESNEEIIQSAQPENVISETQSESSLSALTEEVKKKKSKSPKRKKAKPDSPKRALDQTHLPQEKEEIPKEPTNVWLALQAGDKTYAEVVAGNLQTNSESNTEITESITLHEPIPTIEEIQVEEPEQTILDQQNIEKQQGELLAIKSNKSKKSRSRSKQKEDKTVASDTKSKKKDRKPSKSPAKRQQQTDEVVESQVQKIPDKCAIINAEEPQQWVQPENIEVPFVQITDLDEVQVTDLDEEPDTNLKTYADIVASKKASEIVPQQIEHEIIKPQPLTPKPVQIQVEVIDDPNIEYEPPPVDTEGFVSVLAKKDRRSRSRSRSKSANRQKTTEPELIKNNKTHKKEKLIKADTMTTPEPIAQVEELKDISDIETLEESGYKASPAKSWASIVSTKKEHSPKLESQHESQLKLEQLQKEPEEVFTPNKNISEPVVSETKPETKTDKKSKKKSKEQPEKSGGILGIFSTVKKALGGSTDFEKEPAEETHAAEKKRKKTKKAKKPKTSNEADVKKETNTEEPDFTKSVLDQPESSKYNKQDVQSTELIAELIKEVGLVSSVRGEDNEKKDNEKVVKEILAIEKQPDDTSEIEKNVELSAEKESDIAEISEIIETTVIKPANKLTQENVLISTENSTAQTKEVFPPIEAEQRSTIVADNQTISLFIENECKANTGDNEKAQIEGDDAKSLEKSNGFFNNILSKVTGSKSSVKKKNKKKAKGELKLAAHEQSNDENKSEKDQESEDALKLPKETTEEKLAEEKPTKKKKKNKKHREAAQEQPEEKQEVEINKEGRRSSGVFETIASKISNILSPSEDKNKTVSPEPIFAEIQTTAQDIKQKDEQKLLENQFSEEICTKEITHEKTEIDVVSTESSLVVSKCEENMNNIEDTVKTKESLETEHVQNAGSEEDKKSEDQKIEMEEIINVQSAVAKEHEPSESENAKIGTELNDVQDIQTQKVEETQKSSTNLEEDGKVVHTQELTTAELEITTAAKSPKEVVENIRCVSPTTFQTEDFETSNEQLLSYTQESTTAEIELPPSTELSEEVKEIIESVRSESPVVCQTTDLKTPNEQSFSSPQEPTTFETELPTTTKSSEELLVDNLSQDGPFWLSKSLYEDAEQSWQAKLAKDKKSIQKETTEPTYKPDPDHDRDSDGSSGRGSPTQDKTKLPNGTSSPGHQYISADLPGGLARWEDQSTYLAGESSATEDRGETEGKRDDAVVPDVNSSGTDFGNAVESKTKVNGVDADLHAAKELSESIAVNILSDFDDGVPLKPLTPPSFHPVGPQRQQEESEPSISESFLSRQLKKVKDWVFFR